METECSAAGNSNLQRNHLENDQQRTTASASYANANAIQTTNNPIPRNDQIDAIEQMSLYFFFFHSRRFNEQNTAVLTVVFDYIPFSAIQQAYKVIKRFTFYDCTIAFRRMSRKQISNAKIVSYSLLNYCQL